MLEVYLPIDQILLYLEVSDFPFNFGFIGIPRDPVTAQDINNLIREWVDNIPFGGLNWVVSAGDGHRLKLGIGKYQKYIDLID